MNTWRPNLKILPHRFQDWSHVGIAEVYLQPVAAFLAGIESQLRHDGAQRMIGWKGMRTDRIKRSEDVHLSAGHRCGIANCENFDLHGWNSLSARRKQRLPGTNHANAHEKATVIST
jgi:hypothetical protein